MIRQHISTFLIGLLSGLLAAGIVLLFLARPRRYPIRLLPPPTPSPIRVHVTGAVHHPDVYLLPVDSIFEAAIEAAGGGLPEADLGRVNLAAPIEDGQHIFIPFQVTEPDSDISPAAAVPVNTALIDINQATAAELERLPGIGPTLAQNIVDYRREHGLFLEAEDLLEVSGIGPAKLEQIRDLICCY
jgi:competence protein ComEA